MHDALKDYSLNQLKIELKEHGKEQIEQQQSVNKIQNKEIFVNVENEKNTRRVKFAEQLYKLIVCRLPF